MIAAMQPFLRRHGTDDLSEKSFLYGKSVSNQVRQLQVIFIILYYRLYCMSICSFSIFIQNMS